VSSGQPGAIQRNSVSKKKKKKKKRKEKKECAGWWHSTLILSLWRQRYAEMGEFEASLIYISEFWDN
jgi:hypothetical protein